jgi:hypothetical protein
MLLLSDPTCPLDLPNIFNTPRLLKDRFNNQSLAMLVAGPSRACQAAFTHALPALVGEADLAALESKLVHLQSSVRDAFARLTAA